MLQLRLRLKTLHEAAAKLNLFRSNQPRESEENEYELKNELISTRLFICLLFVSLLILLVYTSQVRVTHTITVDSPSVEVYSSLYEKHPDTLTCPCTNIAIAQEEFISLVPTFHQNLLQWFCSNKLVVVPQCRCSLSCLNRFSRHGRGTVPNTCVILSSCPKMQLRTVCPNSIQHGSCQTMWSTWNCWIINLNHL